MVGPEVAPKAKQQPKTVVPGPRRSRRSCRVGSWVRRSLQKEVWLLCVRSAYAEQDVHHHGTLGVSISNLQVGDVGNLGFITTKPARGSFWGE